LPFLLPEYLSVEISYYSNKRTTLPAVFFVRTFLLWLLQRGFVMTITLCDKLPFSHANQRKIDAL